MNATQKLKNIRDFFERRLQTACFQGRLLKKLRTLVDLNEPPRSKKMQTIVIQKIPQVPATGYLRLNQIIGDAKTPAIIPVKKSCWWAGVKSGRFPEGVKVGRITVWRVEDILGLVERIYRLGKI